MSRQSFRTKHVTVECEKQQTHFGVDVLHGVVSPPWNSCLWLEDGQCWAEAYCGKLGLPYLSVRNNASCWALLFFFLRSQGYKEGWLSLLRLGPRLCLVKYVCRLYVYASGMAVLLPILSEAGQSQ